MLRYRAVWALLILGLAQPATAEQQFAHVFGWLENARIMASGQEVIAKLDSGALTSSLHASAIERFERDGEDWVRFTVDVDTSGDGEIDSSEQFERPLYRNVRIRGAGGTTRRAVVLMEVCLGHIVHEEQFGLEDRSRMNYPMLLGRRTLQHLGVLDVTHTFMNSPSCDDSSEVRRYGEGRSDPDIRDAAGLEDDD